MPPPDRQAARIAAEAAHQPAPPARVVDLHYRLQPEHLASGNVQVVVRAVTSQGIEELVPLLHFEGIARPLLLDAANLTAMRAIAGSPLPVDWPGQTLALRVVAEEGASHIRIIAPKAHVPAPSRPTPPRPPLFSTRNLWATLLLLLVLTAAFAAVYIVEHAPLALPGLPGR